MHPGGPPAQAAGLPEIGQILGGKYQIVRLLGEGGMAFVFEASHKKLQQRVAIKLLAPAFVHDSELVARFEREGRALARLHTKHVVKVVDVDATPEGTPYMVMEFLEGRDVDSELQARRQLPLGESIDIILQACSGMLEAHGMGIVHRDLKPANLFLADDREGSERIVKILDFGISKVVGEATRLTVTGTVMGTVLYMSPEQVRADSNVDMRADIWALGVILFELLAGRAPFEGSSQQIAAKIMTDTPPDLRTFAAVPEGVALAVRRMLERDRARRFASCADVISALAPFAPPGTVGAGIADKMSLTSTGSRGKTAVLASKRTIPMHGTPGYVDRPSSSGSLPVQPSATTNPAATQGAAGDSAGPRSRLGFMLAVAIGLLGAAGAVLTLVALLHRRGTVTTAADVATADVATPASAAPAIAPSSSVAPAVSESATLAPAPPSATTSSRPTGSTVRPPATPKRDAGPARSPAPPAPSATSGLPAVL